MSLDQPLDDPELEKSRQALVELIKIMAREAARVFVELGLEFDMDDPDVARDVMKATFDGLFMRSALEKGTPGPWASASQVVLLRGVLRRGIVE